jgi:catechol 2,3-dioxygenase-like lactoylglutathione lyase family enzyme
VTARRFLHLCYCCANADHVSAFFVDSLGLRHVMQTPRERTPGTILGFDHEIEGCAAFVYDHRGSRVSPAIEVHEWIDPPLVGDPSIDPFEVGIKALGFAVPDVEAAVDRLIAADCTLVARGAAPWAGDVALLFDPNGLPIEVVGDSSVEALSRLRHLRITCSSLDASLAFYERLGFEVIATGSLDDGAFLGLGDGALARYARLRLPDEAFEVVLMEWIEPRSYGRHYREPNHAGLYRAALGVDDTRAAYAELQRQGIVFDRAPMLVELKGTPVPDMWICFLSDPDGIPYEFVQRHRDAFR